MRRNRAIAAGVALVLLALALVAAVPSSRAWIVSQVPLLAGPPSVTVTATPADARIRFASVSATGALHAEKVEPGEKTVEVSRKGYRSRTARVRVERGKPLKLAYALEPLPIPVEVDVRPKTARYRIVCSDGSTKTGEGSFSGMLPAGPTRVSVQAKGCATAVRRLALDSKTPLAVWLDPKGQLVHRLASFETVPAPKGVAISPDGRETWTTALVTQPSILVQDVRTGKKLGSVDLGHNGAVEVVFNKDGSRAYASQMQSASVFEIDTKRRKVLRQLKTKSSWTKIVALAPDQRSLFAANWSGDDISWISLDTGKVLKRMRTVDTPRGMWPTADGRQLLVAGFGENSGVGRLARIDLETGEQKTFFEKRGSAMRHMVADEQRGLLFTSDLGRDCIWVTDMKTFETTKFVTTDVKPNTIDLTPDGRVLVVSCRGENNPKSYALRGPEWGTVLLFDAHTGKPLDAIIGGNQCTALDVSDDGKLLVFSDFLDARLRVYELPPYKVLAEGHGGRYLAHFGEIVKKSWPNWKGPQPPGH